MRLSFLRKQPGTPARTERSRPQPPPDGRVRPLLQRALAAAASARTDDALSRRRRHGRNRAQPPCAPATGGEAEEERRGQQAPPPAPWGRVTEEPRLHPALTGAGRGALTAAAAWESAHALPRLMEGGVVAGGLRLVQVARTRLVVLRWWGELRGGEGSWAPSRESKSARVPVLGRGKRRRRFANQNPVLPSSQTM